MNDKMSPPNSPNYSVNQTSSNPQSTSHSSTLISQSNNVKEQRGEDEVKEKKEYIQQHHLQPYMQEILQFCHNEGIFPSFPSQWLSFIPPTNYSLHDFLTMQGLIEAKKEREKKGKKARKARKGESAEQRISGEFKEKLEQLKSAYEGELERLDGVCNKFVETLMVLLEEHSKVFILQKRGVRRKV